MTDPFEQLEAARRASGIAESALALYDLVENRLGIVGTPDAMRAYPASMIKTPLAVAVYAAAAAGRLELDEPIPVAAANATFNDAPSPVVPGAAITTADLVRYAIDRSDNIATNELLDRVGRAWATTALAELGFPGTGFRRKLSGADPLIDDPDATGRNTHPIDDAARLFAAIARDRVPGAAPIRAALAAQIWNTKLSLGLLPGDAFLHKTGDTDSTSHDGGILFSDSMEESGWVLVVYTATRSPDGPDRRFADVMGALRPCLRRRKEPPRADPRP